MSNYIHQKIRGYRGVIAAGFGLYFSNLRTVFRASWPWVLLFAIAYALQATLAIVTRANPTVLSFCTAVVLSIIELAAITTAIAIVADLLRQHSESDAIPSPTRWISFNGRLTWRIVKALFFNTVLVMVPTLLIIYGGYLLKSHFSPITTIVACCIVLLLLVILLVPLFYTSTKYVYTTAGFWPLLWHGYSIGFRHWGKLFSVWFITYATLLLCTAVVVLPAIVLSIASITSFLGTLSGDPDGMPSYISWLSLATFLIAGGMSFYTTAPLLFTSYFAYGTVEAEERQHTENLQ